MDTPESVLAAFVREGWKAEPFERVLSMVQADASQAVRLLALAVEQDGKDATFLHGALSFVDETDFPELARVAVEALARDKENEVAQGIVSRLSLQGVDALQPYLSRLFFELRPNESSHYASWPWRGASRGDIDELLRVMESEAPGAERMRAFLRAIECRQPDACEAALALAKRIDLPQDAHAYLTEVGLDGPLRRLYDDATFHIVFPMSHLEELSRPSWLSPRNYPSWSLPPLPGTHRFGGTVDAACACCGNPLHNLVRLSGSIDGLSLPGTDTFEVVTCLSCLGWSREVLFFRHDSGGHAHPLPTESCVPEFPANGLKEVDVLLARSPRRWCWQDWALSNGRENLHRVGGHPTWVQSADYPQCPDCGARMKALLQLDSGLPTVDGEEWNWGSGGICYVFCCSRCSVTASLWQCT